MPLTYLLYRCPRCGHDPLAGEKDQAYCPACGLDFRRSGEGGLIRVQDSSGGAWDVAGHRLAEAVQAFTAAELAGEEIREASQGQTLIRRSDVLVRQSGAEAPVHWGGELLGFAEAMDEGVAGVLELSLDALTLRLAPEKADQSWPLLEVRAVQTSSSTLQFSPLSGGLVEFRFQTDSPFRWETLLRESLRMAYRRAGLGEIVEFQPRIVVE